MHEADHVVVIFFQNTYRCSHQRSIKILTVFQFIRDELFEMQTNKTNASSVKIFFGVVFCEFCHEKADFGDDKTERSRKRGIVL